MVTSLTGQQFRVQLSDVRRFGGENLHVLLLFYVFSNMSGLKDYGFITYTTKRCKDHSLACLISFEVNL